MDYANLRTIIGDDILPESFEETNGFLRYKNVNKMIHLQKVMIFFYIL